MSAGLMSCVRENSPPLDMDDMGAISLPSPETPETQKRRRFNPLRNLRRMFRRRTVVTHSETSSPNSTIDQRQQKQHRITSSSDERFNVNVINSNTLPSTLTGSTSVGGVGSGFFLKDKRDHSADSIIRSNNNNNNNSNTINSNNTNNHHHHHHHHNNTNNNSSCDIDIELMNDYQRSLSEGRLINSDYSRDALSQSHDSVFSESATASSLSIVLKAELADALRKRRNRPNNNNNNNQINASDEDIAFAGSPNKHINNIINNQSEGSSSLLSMTTSSDLDEESSSGLGGPSTNAIGYGGLNSTINSTFSSTRISSSSQENSKYSDEFDLDLSFTMISSTQLSHSAAKHKMAIRPKKKGPTRPRRHIEKVLETFPEDNEESMRFNSSDIKNTATKLKSQSLPPGMNVKMLEKHSNTIMSSSMSSASSSSSSSSSAVTTSSTSSTFTSTTKSMITSKILTGSVSTTALRQQSMPEQLISGGTTTTTTTTVNKNQEKIDDVLKGSIITPVVNNNSSSTSNTAPAAEPKEEAGVGFLQRLLNRSINKKKKSITLDSTDNIIINNVYNDIDTTTISDHKRMDASGAYVHQGPIIANDKQTTTAINKTSFIADDNKKLDSLLTATKPISLSATTATTTTTTSVSTGIRKEPAIIIETKPYDQSSLNTYLPIVGIDTDQRINNTKSTQKIEKPIRSGPASRQRVLPQELSLSPQSERKSATSNTTNEDTSPIKTPVTPGSGGSNMTTPTTPNTPKTPPVLNKQTLDFIEQEKLPTTNLGAKSPTKPKTDIKFGSYLPKLITGTTTNQSGNINSDNNNNNNTESTTSISKSQQTNLNDNHSSQLSSSTSSISKTTPNVWIEERNTMSTNTKYQNAKIFGLSSFQQKVSTLDVENNIDIDLDIDNLTSLSTEKRGKPVGKAKSFRFYSDNRNGIDDDIDNRQSMPGGNITSTQSAAQSTTATSPTKHNLYSSTNMPSLPNLTYSEMKNCDTYTFFNKTKFNGTNNNNNNNINNSKPPINNINNSSINNNNNNNKNNGIIIDNENTNLNNSNINDDINNCKLSEYNNDTKYEINDMNLIKMKRDKNDNFKGITKSSSSSVIGSGMGGNVNANITSQQLLNSKQSTILTGTPSSPVPPIKTNHISINSNITEIEDNIDKIMKSSYVTVLKKSSTIDSFDVKPTGKLNNSIINSGGNVSITSISNNDLNAYDKILYETEENRSSSTTSSTSSIKSARNTDINIDAQLNGNVMSTAVNSSVINRKIPPSFLNIQLNRIDSASSATTKQRPKSHIILTKNIPSPTATTKDYNALLGNKERRFSNESVEIQDNKLSSPSSSAMNSHVISPTKQSISMSDITNGNIISMNTNNKLIGTKDYHQQITKQNSLIIERRKSVSDEKLKFEKKIEELNANKDNNNNNQNNNILNNRKKSTDDKIQTDDNISGVVLRKKSVAHTKDDQPELMKVFARRSLKVKDDDDDYDNYNNNDYDTESYITNNHQLPPPMNNKLTSSLSSSAVMSSNIINNNNNNNNNNFQSQNIDNKLIKLKSLTDSDKENQSSSEEKLDKVPKVEITIQNSKQIVNNQNDKNLLKNNDTKLQSTTIIDQIIKPSSNFVTPKPYNVTPNRYSNITQSNYRNQINSNNITTTTSSNSSSTITTTTTKGTSAFLDFRKNLFANSNNTNLTSSVTTPSPPPPQSPSPNTTITQDQNNNINNNYNDNNNNNINLINNRHTINVMSLNDKNAKNINDINMDAEFKGILQRRAEWEKRAKGAFK